MTQDSNDINFRAIVRGAVYSVVGVAIVSGLLWVMYDFYRTRYQSVDARRTLVTPTEIQRSEALLQVDPSIHWLRFKELQLEQLTTYGWTSREQGKVRIPIDRAMQRVVERGE